MGYFKTTVVCGKTIEVCKSYTKKMSGGMGGKSDKKNKTPEEMEKINQKNAEVKLRRILNANYRGGDFHVILTYARDKRQTAKDAKKKVEKLLRKIRAEYKKEGALLKYVNVTEYEKKAIHHHLVINDVEGISVPKLVRKEWKYGGTHFTPLDNSGQYGKLAEYLIKETSKTFRKNDGGHKQRYSCSRNMIRPVPETKVIQKALRWRLEPKAPKGYYVDKDSVENGANGWNGKSYQKYILIRLDNRKIEC